MKLQRRKSFVTFFTHPVFCLILTTFTICSRVSVFPVKRAVRSLSCASTHEIGQLGKPTLRLSVAPPSIQRSLAMDENSGWAVPSWDSLFAGRKTNLTRRKEEDETGAPLQAERTSTSHLPQVEIIARQGQGTMEAELQTAVDEQMPNAVSPPPLAHLADPRSSSPRTSLDQPSSHKTFPEVIRKSHDGYTRAHSGLSMPHVAFTSASTFSGGEATTTADIKSPLTMPQEAFHNIQIESPVRPLSRVQRAGFDSIASNREADNEATPNDHDVPSGQWAEGAAPATSEEAHLQADLWDTMSSLIGLRRSSSSSSSDTDDGKEGFLGAVSRLQSILGESAVDQSQWKKDQGGDIDKIIHQASSSSSPSSDLDEGEGENYIADSGVRYQPTYLLPRLPLVLCHGLFGFGEFSLAPAALRESLPGLSIVYWRGIADTLQRRGVEVLVAKVPMSASIEERAEELKNLIEKTFPNREINLLGHSMGGIDCRLIANLDTTFTVRSVTTIATPHRGSPFADYLLDEIIGEQRLPTLLNLVEKAGIPGGGRAFSCLTTHAMLKFNETCLDNPKTIYMSWGAAFRPGFLHEFRWPWAKIMQKEKENDGLVSVHSAKWGDYRGTIKASHLDLIGWTNKIASLTATISPKEKPFDPKALYLTIAEDLSMRGL